jgi:hypothetical protein
MRLRKWIWTLGLSCGTAALAESPTPYDSIVTRNMFALRPPPLEQSTAPVPETVWTPPPDLKLTGLVVLPPTKKVALYMIEQGKAPKSYVLGEGEQQDDIKVVSIDGKSRTVRVKNREVYVVLDFKTHGLSPGGAAVAPSSGLGR